MIGVDSYVELYTTLFGWHQYNMLWDILTQTGLVFLPFLGILLRNFIEPNKSMKPRSASITSLHRLEIDLFMMLTVVVLAGQPLVTLKTNQLNFIKLCQLNEKGEFETKRISFEQNSAFRKVGFSQATTEARVPVWWYGVIGFSSGFTQAAKTTLPCVKDVRMVRTIINNAEIQDPSLIEEIRQFQRICYYPTYTFAMFGRNENRGNDSWTLQDESVYQQLIQKYTQYDLSWIGSNVFMEMPKSKHFYQGRIVKGYEDEAPTSCYWWWDRLHQKLKRVVGYPENPEDVSLFSDKVPVKPRYPKLFNPEGTPLTWEARMMATYDDAIKGLVSVYLGAGFAAQLYHSQNDFMQGGSGGGGVLAKEWNKWGGWLGMLWDAVSQFPMVHITQEAAYIVQALILMGLYIILPIGLVFSGFSLKFLILGAVAIFCLKFMTYLFHVAWWMDQHLLLILRPTGASLDEQLKIELLMTGLYFFFPALLLALMGWAGLNLGNTLQQVYDKLGGTSSALGQAGSSAVSAVRSTVGAVRQAGGAALKSGGKK